MFVFILYVTVVLFLYSDCVVEALHVVAVNIQKQHITHL